MDEPFRQILGVRFYVGHLPGALALADKGGLCVVPSAPVLADMTTDVAHRAALIESDFALTDSGFLVLLWLATRFERLERISGLRFLRALLEHKPFREPGATFWVMPSAKDSEANLAWLATQGIAVPPANSYLAPHYPSGALTDSTLLAALEKQRPSYVVLGIGGGVQERLGHYLRRHLSYRPCILCTGAAIAFLSGRQANIPVWADRLMLGWLFRVCESPRKYWPRYQRSFKLAWLLLRHGPQAPS